MITCDIHIEKKGPGVAVGFDPHFKEPTYQEEAYWFLFMVMFEELLPRITKELSKTYPNIASAAVTGTGELLEETIKGFSGPPHAVLNLHEGLYMLGYLGNPLTDPMEVAAWNFVHKAIDVTGDFLSKARFRDPGEDAKALVEQLDSKL